MKKQLASYFLVLLMCLFLFELSYVTGQFFILVCIGLVASFVGTLAGGGGLITLPAMLLAGIPIHTGIATNKFSTGVSAFSSVFSLLYQKQISMKEIIRIASVSFFGGVGGALIATQLAEHTMNFIAFFLLAFALNVTINSKQWTKSAQDEATPITASGKKSLLPFLIGAYDGGFGPGSATFGIIYYIKKQHSYMKSVQLTRVLVFASSTGAFLIFYQSGYFQWSYSIALAIGSTIGTQIGLMVLPKVPMKTAKTLLITIICLLITEMVYKII